MDFKKHMERLEQLYGMAVKQEDVGMALAILNEMVNAQAVENSLIKKGN